MTESDVLRMVVSDGLLQPGADEYAAELYELIDGYFPLNRVRRSVGFFGVRDGWVPNIEDVETSVSQLLDFNPLGHLQSKAND